MVDVNGFRVSDSYEVIFVKDGDVCVLRFCFFRGVLETFG